MQRRGICWFALLLTLLAAPSTGAAEDDGDHSTTPIDGHLHGWYDTENAPPGDGAVEGFLYWNKGKSGIEAVFRISPGHSQAYAGPQLNLPLGGNGEDGDATGRFHAAAFVGVQDFYSGLYPRWAMELSLTPGAVELYGRVEHDFGARGAGLWYTAEFNYQWEVAYFGLRGRRFAGVGPLLGVKGDIANLPIEAFAHWGPVSADDRFLFTPGQFQFGLGLYF